MKLVCDKAQLVEIINTVQRAISHRPTNQPIQECIKIDADGAGHVIFTGNTELCIEYNTDCTVTEGGSIALKSGLFGDIVRRLPDGNVSISVNLSNDVTTIKSGSSKFNIQGMTSENFPNTPILDEKFRFTLTQSALRRVIRKTIAFVAQNEGKKPVLTGTLFEIKNNVLNLVSSDGHRIALVKEEIKETVEDCSFIVPGQTQRELLKLLKDEEDMVTVIVDGRTVLFDFGNYQVYSRLIDGEFLKYNSIISVDNKIKVVVEKKNIVDSLERALLLINADISAKSENKVPVRFNIGYDKIELSCITDKGQISDTIPVEMTDGDLLIGFNCRFLLDALSTCDEEKIKIEFSAPTSGCFIRSTSGDDSYVYMILPVRLYN